MSPEPPLSGTAEDVGDGRTVTVLVVDDNDVALRLCRRVLQKAGYKVLTATDGLEGVSVALANSPDVILMDVAMPGIDGLEATRRIKQQRPGIAIVIASVLATASNRERFLAAGADDVLMPPFRLSDMIAAVATLTANRGPQMKDVTGTRLGSYEIVPEILKGDREVRVAAKSSGPPKSRRWLHLRIPPWRSRRREEQPASLAIAAAAASMSEGSGYGTLDALLHDQSVSEIMVNGPDEVFIERRGIVTRAKVRFDDETQVLETIQRLVATTGQHIDVENPIVEAYLPDGSRINAIIPPASSRGPALTIRKFPITALTMNDLTRDGTLSPAMAEFLQAAVLGRLNILVSGAAGSGKTATLNVLARFVPHNQRVITIEEGAELQIGHPHVVSLLHRPVDVDDEGEPTIRQLLHQGTRMLPDRILFGEVRGAEAIDLLEAMNNGQDGSMSTISSKSARDALYRLETMVKMASIHMPLEAVHAQIASAVNLIVHQVRLPDGRRKIVQIAEVVGYDANGVILRDIFLLGMGSDLRLQYNATSYDPTSLDKAAFFGVIVSQDLFDPVKSRFVPAGSDTMMPVVKDPLMSGQRGSGQHTQSMASTQQMQEEMRKLIDAARSAVADLQAAASQPAPQPPASAELVPPPGIPEPPTTESTPEAQQEMRKLIDAARAAVADLQADLPGQGGASPGPKASKKRSTRK
ncbi:MAG TPA: ATPase, T2SS/T4P/T4SS family [Candidatus Dormibacteraeota bacterium]|nr:ATPase, T2SS/T4P/T4SS family [Candidatus Dormibacteraeota bacterium]